MADKKAEKKPIKLMNFTIDSELRQEFREYCKTNSLNMSSVIRGMIKDFINPKK